MRTHQEIDRRSLDLHRLIASKIRNNPALFSKVQDTLARWRGIVSESTQPYLLQWETLIDQGIEKCLAVAEEDSPNATALRQSSPFCGILTNQERHEFLKSWGK